jgi:DNA-binding response OmpR family regulator
VDAVYDGQDAIDFASNDIYDMMILDIMLPKKNGFDVLKEIRAASNMIPVLVLSARSSVDDRVRGLDLGANDYLTKPFSPKELLARIRVLSRVQYTQRDDILNVGNINLDRSSHELSSTVGSYHLANKEYQMMELFMSHPNRVYSIEFFIEKIWGYDSNAETNLVWTYVSYLRKKLNALHANIKIKAYRNTGYSLEQADD